MDQSVATVRFEKATGVLWASSASTIGENTVLVRGGNVLGTGFVYHYRVAHPVPAEGLEMLVAVRSGVRTGDRFVNALHPGGVQLKSEYRFRTEPSQNCGLCGFSLAEEPSTVLSLVQGGKLYKCNIHTRCEDSVVCQCGHFAVICPLCAEHFCGNTFTDKPHATGPSARLALHPESGKCPACSVQLVPVVIRGGG